MKMSDILRSIKSKLSVKISIAIASVTIVLLLLAGGTIIYTLQLRYEQQAEELMEDTNAEIRQTLDIVDHLMSSRVHSAVTLFREQMMLSGSPSLRGTAVVGGESVPALFTGATSQSNRVEIVDHVKRITGASATFFVRRNDEFIRISTNVKKSDGSRALGTTLDPAGAAYKQIIQGKPYYGVVGILGKPFYTAYEPLLDTRGEVIGILFTGYPIETLKFVEDLVRQHVVLKNGFIAMLDNKDAVLFKGAHVEVDRVKELNAAPNADWNVKEYPYEKWGYTILAAYPLDDVTSMVLSDAIPIIFGAFGMSVIIVIILNFTLRNLVIRPLKMLENAAMKISTGSTEVDVHTTSQDELGNVANAFQRMVNGIKEQSRITKAISEGHLKFKATIRSDEDLLNISLQKVIDSLQNLGEESKRLTEAAVRGELSVRGDMEKFKGKYREIIVGINHTLDAVIGPLNVAAKYVDDISKGRIPPKITDNYNGDFNEIKNNLNMAIDAVNALVADAMLLSKAAVEGKLATRADASKHHGDYQKIVQGVNDTLDSVIRPLNVAAEYVDRISKGDIPNKITDSYNGDFNEIKNNLNTCIDAVNALVADASLLAKAALEGKLSTRADASKHGGDFRKIVQGVNDTLDSVINPLNVAAKYVDDISRGAIPAKITDNYNGDFNTIKLNLNQAIDAINALVTDANMLSAAAVEGQLETRADASRHNGDFKRIVTGVNDTLDAVILPVQEGAKVLAKMSEGDLTVRVVGEYKGDHQLLKNSINTVGRSLNKALLDVTQAVEATASASSQISSSTEEMAAGSQEQSSQANEVASAVEQMTKTIIDNSRNASTAAETAKKAKEAAGQGGKVVDETILGMKRIAEVVNVSAETVKALGKSSEQIGEIIAVIDDIADQTNLLALNAAIEAARAGEQGRGFAVVADEVRKLAERTTKATKEIASMIKQIQSDTSGAVTSMNEGTTEVSKGIKLADKAGESLGEIVNISQTVTDMITQIATASEEQSSTSEQISKNVETISTVTSQAATSTQQVARAAEDLNRLTENLQKLIARFTISGSLQRAEERNTVRRHQNTEELAEV